MAEYNVVYRYLVGPSKGLAFYTSFTDQAAFEKDRAHDDPNKLEVVVAGVSSEAALEICGYIYKGIPPDDLVARARALSTNKTTGELNPDFLGMELKKIGTVRGSF